MWHAASMRRRWPFLAADGPISLGSAIHKRSLYDSADDSETGSELLTEASTRDLRTYYKALGDDTRLRILQLLATEGEHTVSAIALRLRLSQPLLSWHLRRLRRAGVVRTVRAGREVRCTFDRERFAQLHERGFRTLMNPPITGRSR